MNRLQYRLLGVNRAVKQLNYSARFYARKHSLCGVQFRSYDPVIQSEPLIEEMVNRCSMGEVLYDVGAHVGVFSLLAARLGLESIAFEPNPDAYSRLIANIEANEFESITPLNVGISDENDKLEFYVSSQQARSSFNQEHAEFGVAEVIATEKIPVTSLDNYQGKLQLPDHLKIDVEGFGLKLLRGATEMISKSRPIIYIEPHENEGEVKEWMADKEYAIEELGYSWLCTPLD